MSRPHLLSLAFACMLATSCKDPGHAHEGEAAHGHGEGAAHGATNATEPERPGLTVTVYQEGLELFMEYPALVVGQPSPLVAHFTDARDPEGFKVVTKGRVTATLRYADGSEERFVAEKLLRDGIFKPEVRPTKPGAATLTLRLEGEQVSGTVEAGQVMVHPSLAAAVAAASPEESAGAPSVPFLKEQQWKTRYATTPAEARVLQGGVRANGELKPVAGQAAELSAPVAGRILVGGLVPHLGQRVKAGDVLVRLAPTAMAGTTDLATVEMEAARARAELGLAEREVTRAEEMFAAKALPEKQLDTARVAREVAAAKVAATERQLSLYRGTQSGAGGAGGAAFELRSPLEGVVSFADVTPGAVVQAGTRLVSVLNPSRLWLEAKVYEVDAPKVEHSPGAAFTVAGFTREFTVDEKTGRRVAVGTVVDPETRTVPVLFELPNPEGMLKPGMFAKVTLYTGETVRALAVPEAAVVDDNGRPTVFVMEGGESFFKRTLRPGIRSGGWVQVLDGVKEGERVVSRGAYELKLSTATGAIPEHGHQH
ncbi:efflux RND transporter periplasmic adaptor subunit [Corallococcus carmarthensis]|uniref:efflux RND transporter periplasmic adaptor subunit n=1 Tax=Corallococcus carmarthensis TaxID=2316728 RepID=UPI00148D7086|nr:efflux RND transporter periplasmic adaptor subunit [Corallococcus carmarthensis]NOK19416.1 efflux RND transporter periplasmic adaptor subunit [Corallococcus carmarthensis]